MGGGRKARAPPSDLRRVSPPPPRHPDGKGGDAWTWKASCPPCIRWWTIGGGSCTRRPRANPRPPRLSDGEVLTLAVLSQWPRFRSERDFWRFADAHLRGHFPNLLSQSQFNRHVRALEPELRALQRDLSRELADDSEVYRVLDTTLVPAIVRAKARRKGFFFAGKAAVGRSVSKTEWIYGFKVWPSRGSGEREMRDEHRVTTKCMPHIYSFVNFPFRGAAGR